MMQKSDTVKDLFIGLVKLRQAIKQPPKDAKNPFFKSNYVTLEGVQKAIDEAKEGTGIDYSQFVETSPDGRTGVSTMVYSDKGEYIITDPLYLQPVKNDPQGNGSVVTYSRRYQLSALFGISSDIDDDGNNASGNQQNRRQQRQGNYQRRQQKPSHQQAQNPIAMQKQQFEQTVNKIAAAMDRSTQEIEASIQSTITADSEYQAANNLGKWQKINNMANQMLKKSIEENSQGASA